MSKGIEHKPSRTAIGTTLFRSIANKEYNNSKFGTDDLAEYFLPFLLRLIIKFKRNRTHIKQRFPPGMYEYLIARTQYFDNLFKDALDKKIPQIVLLGAGYDTRAYRFSEQNTDTRIIEIDIETTQRNKLACLKKAKIKIPENTECISANFNKDNLKDILVKAKFNIHAKTLYLWEGVTYYLEPESIDKLLESIKNISFKGSLIAFDYLVWFPSKSNDKLYGVEESRDFMIKNNPQERTKFLIQEGKTDIFLEQRGFEIVEHLNNTAIEERFLFNENQSLIGHIIATFRFALARLV
jgi:methyltransferase (TIGR00027 family)